MLFLAAVTARLAYRQLSGFTADDAFITFRYAANLAAGRGFVYNPGEHVLGTTTPLFTLLLGAFAAAGIRPETAALALSLLSAGVVAVLLHRWARAWGFGAWESAPAVLFVVWPRAVAPDASGMETAFFTLLLTLALYLRVRRRPLASIAVAGLAALTRPEGLWLLLLLVGERLWRERGRGVLQVCAWPAALLLPWAVFCELYFGSLVPSSVTGKLALYAHTGEAGPLGRALYLLGGRNPFPWLLSAAAAAGAWWLVRRRNCGRLEIAWLLGMLGFYIAMPTHLFFWYLGPFCPVFLLLGGAALPLAGERLSWRLERGAVARAAALAAAVVVVAAANIAGILHQRVEQDAMLAVHRRIGLYLEQHAGAGDLVAAEDIGYIGYWSQRRILDRDGLVSPSVHERNRAGDYLDAVLDRAPEWVVADMRGPTSSFLGDARFLARYRPDLVLSSGSREYAVYRRRGT